jgi:glycosyltransferase involved in cell wall biosynthesis
MNILVLSNKPPFPPKDGGAIATFNLAKGLAENGHSVHVLAMNTSKHKVNINSLPKFNNLTFTYIEVNTEIKFLNAFVNLFFSKFPYNAERFISKGYLSELEKIIQEQHFDIVQLEGPYLWFCVGLIKKYSKAPISFRAHNVEFEIWQRAAEAEKNIIKKFYLNHLSKRIKWFELSLINLYDFLIPITARDEKLFCSFGNTKPSFVVPVGIDVPELKENVLNNKSIFYIGALDWIPNQEGLLWFIDNVFHNLIAQHNNIQFHIAGRNAPDWLIKKFAFKNIFYHGEIDDAHSFILNSGIMLVPLFSGSGMRVKIVEGLALGKPIITTSIGAEGIDITDGENIIIADDSETFCKKLFELIENSGKANLLSLNGRKFAVQNYNYIAIAKNLADFYINHQNIKN